MKIPPILQKHYQKLCTSCGVCVAACPQNVLKMDLSNYVSFTPIKNEINECVECGLCTRVCTGVEALQEYEWHKLNHEELIIGYWRMVYNGYATDREIRKKGASGGIVTALLLGLLEDGSIDGALVTIPKNEDAFTCKTILAKTRNEILRSIKSKYTQVDYANGLRNLSNARGGRFAVVGLPCHISSITKWTRISNELKDKIFLKIGLFCGRGATSDLSKFIAKSIGINSSHVSAIDFRSGNWSDFGFKFTGDFGERWLPFNRSIIARLWSTYLFCPERCLLCNDGFSTNADISLGDAWRMPNADQILGTSLIITRTEHGQKILERLQKQNIFFLDPISPIDVLQSQPSIVRFKKINLPARINLWHFLSYPVPNIKISPYNSRLHFKAYLSAVSILITAKFSALLQRWGVLHKIPTKLLSLFLRVLQRINRYG